MPNSQRYRLNSAECLVAATSCQGDYRGLLICIAAFWHALARQDEAIEKLLASWDVAEPARQTGQVLAFQPTSPAGVSSRRRDTLHAKGRRRRVSEPNASSALNAHFAFGLLEAGPRARALIAISPFWSISPQITALSMGRRFARI
jgi:hypothetical protein